MRVQVIDSTCGLVVVMGLITLNRNLCFSVQ